MTGPTFERVPAERVGQWVFPLAGLYATVYAEQPYGEGPEQAARFADALRQDAGRPGFTLIVAHHELVPVAAAYGWTMPAGTWWSRSDGEPPADIKAADKVAVMEWVVHPWWRGQGHGARVLSALLDGRAEPWATLASDPRSYARDVYTRQGWVQVGTSVLPWGPPMDLLAKRLG